MYIVLEYYLMENFAINFFILYITKIITKTNIKFRRIILGAFLSAIYSLIFFEPALLFMSSFFMKIIISMLIIKLSFQSKEIKTFIYQMLGFYTVSFLFAGIITSISWGFIDNFGLEIKNNSWFYTFSTKQLLIGTTIGSIIAFKIFNYNFQMNISENNLVDIEIVLKGKSSFVKALVDTGNKLVTPVSNKAVFVVEYSEIQKILPKEFNKIYENSIQLDYNLVEDWWDDLNTYVSLKLIPFKSLGEDKGIIFGFNADYIVINRDKGRTINKDIVIGIYQGKLSGKGKYSGLIGYEAIIGGDHIEKNII